MGSAYIPSQTVVDVEVGTLSAGITSPYITILINGVAYPNGYKVEYAGGFRNFCGVYDSGNNKIYVRCHTIAYGEDLPEFTLSNVEVIVIG
jgi:hypothetical protein